MTNYPQTSHPNFKVDCHSHAAQAKVSPIYSPVAHFPFIHEIEIAGGHYLRKLTY